MSTDQPGCCSNLTDICAPRAIAAFDLILTFHLYASNCFVFFVAQLNFVVDFGIDICICDNAENIWDTFESFVIFLEDIWKLFGGHSEINILAMGDPLGPEL